MERALCCVRFQFSGPPQKRRLGCACVLCLAWPEQLRQPGAWRAHSPGCGAPSPLRGSSLSFRLRRSGACTLSLAATLPEDVDHPESQEVFGLKLEACLQWGRGCGPWGRARPFPLPLPPASGGAGPVRSQLALLWTCSDPLFCKRLAVCSGRLIFSLFCCPQFKLESPRSSLRLPSGHSGPVLTVSNAARSSPFCPHLLVADVGVWGTFLLGVAFRHVICGFYLFSLPVRLPSEIWKLPSDPPVRGFPGVWNRPLLRLPSQNGSPSLALLSLFLSFIFCPTSFWRQWAAFLGTWCPLLVIRSCFVEFAQRSNVLSMNL